MNKQQTRNRIIMLVVLGAPFLSWALATASFHWRIGVPEATTNRGALLESPPNAAVLDLQSPEGLLWRLLVPIDKHWNEERFGFLQRTYLALGRDRNHLQVVLFSTKDSDPSPKMPGISALELPGAFKVLRFEASGQTSQQHLDQALQNICPHGTFADCWYAVSDKNRILLAYPATTSDRAVLDDFARILRHIPDQRGS